MRLASLLSIAVLLLASGCGDAASDSDGTDPGGQQGLGGSHDETPSSCTLRFDPNERSFDPIESGTTRSYEIHVVNDGEEDCAVTGVSLERGHDVVRLARIEDGSIAPGASLLLRITFTPTEPGVVEPNIRLHGNGDLLEHPLRFEAFAGDVVDDPCVFLDPGSIEFEERTVGCGVAERAIVLRNECDHEIHVIEADTGANHAFARGAAPELPRGVPAGGELRFPVLFSPHEPGATTGRLRIRVDGMPAFEAPLVGHGIEAAGARDVFHAAAGQRVFELSHRPAHVGEGGIDEVLELHVNHTLVRPVAEGERNWGYGEVRNLVEFTAGRGPDEGAEVVIEYAACPAAH